MSSVVQRARATTSTAAPKRPDPTNQHWGMLLFESLSAGAMTVAIGMGIVMALVGVYVMLVWPLTFWDLASLGLEKYGSWANTAIWSIFAGGSLAGFWCFSGAAFKSKSRPRVSPNQSTRSRR